MKKPLLLLGAVALSFQLNAQKLWKNEVDEFTGDVKKFTKHYIIATTNVGQIKASAIRINDHYYLSLKSTSDIGCAGARDNYVIIKFTDGTTLKLDKDLADIECADSSPSLFSILPNGDLANKEIEKIRFRQSKYYTDGNTSGTYSLSKIINVTKNN